MAGDQTLRQVPILQPSDTRELKYGTMSFTLESGANFLSRRDDFGYVFSILAEVLPPGLSSVGSHFPVIEGPCTNYDSLGGGSEITVGYPINDKYSIEFSFQGASASSGRSSSLVPTFPTLGYIVPVIDGQNIGVNDDQLVSLSLLSGRTKLDYESWYVDTFLGLNRTVLKNTNTELQGIVGLAYAHFEQDFEHKMIGTGPSSSNLDEDLRDNLFGLKGGLRLSRRVTRKIQIEGSVFGGAYYRKSKLDADQELINVSAIYRDINASVNDRNSHFVPMSEGILKVRYKINDQWDLAFSSGASAWWCMSNVNNPKPMSGFVNIMSGGNRIDRVVHIGDDDRLMDYHLGLAITFRH